MGGGESGNESQLKSSEMSEEEWLASLSFYS